MLEQRSRLTVSAALALVAALGLGLLVRGPVNAVDAAWMQWMPQLRSPPADAVAVFLHEVGAGVLGAWIVPAALALVLLLSRRPWAATLLVVAAIAEPLIVRLLKTWFARERPADGLVEAGFGAYPSGHAARAAMLATVFVLVFPRVWVFATGAVYTALMMLSRTWLGVHWLTDVIGGAVIGGAVAVFVWSLLARRLHTENTRPHPPPGRDDRTG